MRRRPRPRRRRGRGGPDGDALAVHRPLRRRFSAPHHAPAGRGGRRRATSEASRRDGGRARRSRSPASPASALRFAERAPLLAVVGAALIRWPRDDSGGGDGGGGGDDGGGGEPDSGGPPPLALGLTLRVGARGGEVTRALALRIGRSLFAPAPGECARDDDDDGVTGARAAAIACETETVVPLAAAAAVAAQREAAAADGLGAAIDVAVDVPLRSRPGHRALLLAFPFDADSATMARERATGRSLPRRHRSASAGTADGRRRFGRSARASECSAAAAAVRFRTTASAMPLAEQQRRATRSAPRPRRAWPSRCPSP